jgi:hypothetical protein
MHFQQLFHAIDGGRNDGRIQACGAEPNAIPSANFDDQAVSVHISVEEAGDRATVEKSSTQQERLDASPPLRFSQVRFLSNFGNWNHHISSSGTNAVTRFSLETGCDVSTYTEYRYLTEIVAPVVTPFDVTLSAESQLLKIPLQLLGSPLRVNYLAVGSCPTAKEI